MEYVKLGNSDIDVSRLCVGCMSFGDPASNFHAWTLNQEETDGIVKHALDLGINFFDTANVYSRVQRKVSGQCPEKYITRDKAVIATKVYFNEGKLKREAILREIDGSLQRLDTDYVDLLIIHRFDYDTPIEETMEALHDVVKSGKARAIGASAMYCYQFAKLQHSAEKNGWTKFISMQNHYNLLYREDERETIPYCREEGIALTPYSPLAAGRLSRPSWNAETKRSETDATAVSKYDRTKETDIEIVKRVSALAEQKNVTMTQIALAWQFAKGITAPLIGATKAKYFDDAVGSLEVKLSKDDIALLEELYVPHEIVGAL